MPSRSEYMVVNPVCIGDIMLSNLLCFCFCFYLIYILFMFWIDSYLYFNHIYFCNFIGKYVCKNNWTKHCPPNITNILEMFCMHYIHRNTTIKSFKQLRMQPFSMQQKYRYLKNETHNSKIYVDLGALCSSVEQHIVMNILNY